MALTTGVPSFVSPIGGEVLTNSGSLKSELPDWISNNGRDSSGALVLGVSANEDRHNERKASVKVGDVVYYIRQVCYEPVQAEPSSFSFRYAGGSVSVALNRNNYPDKGDVLWYALPGMADTAVEAMGIAVECDASWIKAVLSSDESTLSLTVADGEGVISRKAEVKIVPLDYRHYSFSDEIAGYATTIVVNQVGETLSLGRSSETVDFSGSTVSVSVSAVGASGLKAESDSEWAVASLVGDRLWIEYEANSGVARRSAEITVSSAEGLSSVFTLVQLGNYEVGGNALLQTWQHSADTAYVLIYYSTGAALVLDIWDEATRGKVGSAVIDGFSGDATDVRFYGVNDVMYVAHEDIRPKKLMRVDDEAAESGYSFIVQDFDIKIEPVLDEYSDRNVFVVASGTYGAGDTVLVTEKSLTDGQKRNNAELLFTSGSYWRGTGRQMLMLKKSTEMMKCYAFLYPESSNSTATKTQTPKPDTVYQDDNGGLGSSTPWLFAFGKISIETAGRWSGRIVVDLWKPDMDVDEAGEPVSPEQLAVLEVSNATSNKSVSRDLTMVGSRIRIRCEAREKAQGTQVTTNSNLDIIYRDYDNDSGCYVTVSNAQEIPVYLRVKSVVPPVSDNDTGATTEGYAYCEAIHPFDGGFTSSSFAEGAWCEGRYGYPRTVGVFQERMIFGGNRVKPCTLWCSKVGDWSNFVQGSESTSPIFATANTDNIDTIQWMQIAKSYVMFGSLSGEWYFGGSDGGAVKPSNYSFQRLSNFGSTRGVDAVLFGESTLVAKNGGRQVVDVSYNTLSEQGSGTNLSLFAAHLFEESVISDMASTISPTSILWVLRDDGVLLSFTYEANNNVFAWARHEILDGVSAITSFRRGERDVLAMLVRDGDKVMLSELDAFRGDDYTVGDESVFCDEGANGELVRYESRIIPTPIGKPRGRTYDGKAALKGLDVYLNTRNGDFNGEVYADGVQFSVKMSGGDEYVCDNGWLATNMLREFGENKIELPVSGGWEELVLADIHTDYPAPLTITALGAGFEMGGD